MKLSCTILLFLASVSTLAAQTVPPALMVQQDGRAVPLGLARLQTEVRIYGAVAETTATMTFTNPAPRAMEGDLYFPLPEGATISGYALDINGAMIDGVAVEKHEARRIYEEVVRKGIDPGLVQWTQGNNFQTRVFPIPAQGSRTVRVSYVAELLGGKEAPAYCLPLKFKDKIREFSLRVEVVKPAAPPKVTKGELANFAFEKWHESYVAETKQQDWSPVEDLVIALPKADGPQVLVEQADDGQTYVAIQDYPQRPATESQPPLASPRRVVVFWDASGSRTGDHGREIALLRQLQGMWTAAYGNAPPELRIDLVLFRNAASPPQHIELGKAGPAELAAALEKVQYDGGTQLGVIGPVGAEKPDLYLLFTDGISNFGSEEPARLDAPLYVFSNTATANHALLHSLAMANGGQYFNLVNWKDAEILAQVGRPAWSFLSAAIERGEAKDLYPQRPQPLAGRFTLVGKLANESAKVTVKYGIQGGKSQQQTFTASSADAVQGSLLRRLWAQKKLAHLMIHQKANEKEITALGKQFGLVTPYTSLLVLDSLEQYVQYEIAPPKSLPAMREEYARRIDTLEHQKQKLKADKLAEVLRMWDERVRWWQSEFKYAKGFKYKGGQEGQFGGVAYGTLAAPMAARDEGRAPANGQPARQMQERARNFFGPAPVTLTPAPGPRLEPMEGRSLLTESLAVHNRSTAGKEGEDKSEASPAREPGIVIRPWQPDMPYLKELKASKDKGDLFAVYMKQRARYGTSPAFFLDCADFFREAGRGALALQVLSNIAELQLEEATLLRVLGYRLLQIGELDLAVETFEQVLALRPEEPQSYRDLALALTRRAENDSRLPDLNRADYARAADLLVQVVMGRWDARFPEIEVIALEELNRTIPRAKAAGLLIVPQETWAAMVKMEPWLAKRGRVAAISLDPRLIQLLDLDVRIVMTWNADNTDIDLWVTEPSGEKAFYGHNRTTIGGLVSCDFTQGYGPEEYLVRRAAHGTYKIDANYFGSRATRLLGPVTVQVDVLTNYGRPNERRKSLTLRLKEAQETVRIGEIEF